MCFLPLKRHHQMIVISTTNQPPFSQGDVFPTTSATLVGLGRWFRGGAARGRLSWLIMVDGGG